MAVSRKGLRKIVVDGEDYVWKVGRPTYYNSTQGTMKCIVQKSASIGMLLVIDTEAEHIDNWLNMQLSPINVVTPDYISRAIREALKTGWKPTEPNGKFLLKFPLHREGVTTEETSHD